MANAISPFTSYRADTGKQFKPREGVGKWFLGNPELFRQVPKYSPEIMGSINQLLQNAFQGIQNPQAGFEPFAQQARTQFETQTIPGLAERFTSMGGGQRSSAFQNALGSAGAGLEQNLAALGSQYGLENRMGLLKQLMTGLQAQPKFEFTNRQGGFLNNVLGPIFGNYATQAGGQQAGDLTRMLVDFLPFLL